MSELAQVYGGIDAPSRWRRNRSVATTNPEPEILHGESKAVEDQTRALVASVRDISWSGDKFRSAAARDALILGGSLTIPILLRAVDAFPRADIVDEAIAILARIAENGAFYALLESAMAPEFTPPARAAAARALGVAGLGDEDAKRALKTIAKLLSDPSAEVRDAAVAALSDRGGSEAKKLLQDACDKETIDFVRDAIREAIEEC